jgi:quercetin dioxygenase-like cupin family protein
VKPTDARWQRVLPKADAAVLGGNPNRKGAEYVVRYRLRRGLVIPPHWHPGDEHVTVLSGKFRMGFGKKGVWKNSVVLGPGDYVFIPRRVVHFTRTEQDAVLQAHGVGPFKILFVNPAADPLRGKKPA